MMRHENVPHIRNDPNDYIIHTRDEADDMAHVQL